MYSIKQNVRDATRHRVKPSFLKRWIYSLVKEVRDYEEYVNVPSLNTTAVSQTNHIEGKVTLNFAIHFADGGKVVQMNHYDSQTDRSTHRLYIITNDKDFGKELDKIITMEGLCR